jgi:hypothetical protein
MLRLSRRGCERSTVVGAVLGCFVASLLALRSRCRGLGESSPCESQGAATLCWQRLAGLRRWPSYVINTPARVYSRKRKSRSSKWRGFLSFVQERAEYEMLHITVASGLSATENHISLLGLELTAQGCGLAYHWIGPRSLRTKRTNGLDCRENTPLYYRYEPSDGHQTAAEQGHSRHLETLLRNL